MAEPEGLRGESVVMTAVSIAKRKTAAPDPDAAKENDTPVEKRGARQRSQRARSLKKYVPKREFIKARSKSKDAAEEGRDRRAAEEFSASITTSSTAAEAVAEASGSPSTASSKNPTTLAEASTLKNEARNLGKNNAGAASPVGQDHNFDPTLWETSPDVSVTQEDASLVVDESGDASNNVGLSHPSNAEPSVRDATTAIISSQENIPPPPPPVPKPPKLTGTSLGVLEFAMKKASRPARALTPSEEHLMRDPDGVCTFLNTAVHSYHLRKKLNDGSETSKPNSVELNKRVNATEDKAATTEKIISVLERTARPSAAKLERQPTVDDSAIGSESSQSFHSTIEEDGDVQHDEEKDDDDEQEHDRASLKEVTSEELVDEHQHSSFPPHLDGQGDSGKQYPSECSAEDPQKSSLGERIAWRPHQPYKDGKRMALEMTTSGKDILQDLEAFTSDAGSIETSLSRQILYDTEDRPVAALGRGTGHRNSAALQNAMKICAEARLSMSSSGGTRSPDRDPVHDSRQIGQDSASSSLPPEHASGGDRPLLLVPSRYLKLNSHVNIFRRLDTASTDDSSTPMARMRYSSQQSVGNMDIPPHDDYGSDCAHNSYDDDSSLAENEGAERRARVSFAGTRENRSQDDLSECHGSVASNSYTNTTTREKERFDDVSSSKASSIPTVSDARTPKRSSKPQGAAINEIDESYDHNKALDSHPSNVSVDSSYARSEARSDVGSVFSALFGPAKKSKYVREYSDDESYVTSEDGSSCTGGTDEDEEEFDERTFLASFFGEEAAGADEGNEGKTGGFDFASKWCDDLTSNMPSVPQLEDLIKAASDFGLSEKHMRVKQDPNPEELPLVDEYSKPKERTSTKDNPNPEGARKHQSPAANPGNPDVSLADPEHQMALVPVHKRKVRVPRRDASSDQECGVLTLEDIKEIAAMVTAAIRDVDSKAKSVNKKVHVPRLAIHYKPSTRRDLDRSNDSSEVAWDRVEQTVGDMETVAGSSIVSVEDPDTVKDRITAKLHHFRSKQPQLYKVLLAKLATAESGKDFRIDCEEIIKDVENGTLDTSKVQKASSHVDSNAKSVSSRSDEHLDQPTEPEPALTPKAEVVAETRCDSIKPALSWESFGGSPFKDEERDQANAVETLNELTDSGSCEKDTKLRSAKANLRKIGDAKSSATSKLKEKIELYSKKNPELYRILLTKVAERKKQEQGSSRLERGGSSEGDNRVIRAVRLLNASLKGRNDKNLDKNDSSVSKKKRSSKSHVMAPEDGEEAGSVNSTKALPSRNLGDDRKVADSAQEFTAATVGSNSAPAGDEGPCNKSQSSNHPTTSNRGDNQASKCNSKVSNELQTNTLNQSHRESDDITVETSCTEQSVELSLSCESTDRGQSPAKSQGNPEGDAQKPLVGSSKLRKSDFDSLRAAIAQRNWKQYVDRNESSMKLKGRGQANPGQDKKAAKIVEPTTEIAEKAHKFTTDRHEETISVALKTDATPQPSGSSSTASPRPPLASNPLDRDVGASSKSPLASCHLDHNVGATSKPPLSSRKVNRSSMAAVASIPLEGHCSDTIPPTSAIRSPTCSKPEIVKPHAPACSREIEPEKAKPSGPSSTWESFDGSNFKEMLMNSFTDDKGSFAEGRKKFAEALNYQETFLDSILPAPPTFSAASHDQWTDFSSASAQWEHFSPLSFDPNYTKWGSSRRAPPKPAARSSQKPSSPSSVAEI